MCSPPSLRRESLTIRGHLGSGSFADVLLVVKGSEQPGSHSKRSYALKQLHSTQEFSETSTAVSDLINEVNILTSLPYHDHIVQLQGLSQGFWNEPEEGFLLLDVMEETLQDRLQRLRHRSSTQSKYTSKRSILPKCLLNRSSRHAVQAKEEASRIEQLGLGIASAFQFLHSHGVIFRDLKPANVGIGFDGKVRLLDFGLAKQLGYEDSERRMTGSTGTARYMAPEVALNEDYDISADVYSFSILLWEICTLERPFSMVPSREKMLDLVAKSRLRPPLRKVRSPMVRELLSVCWDRNPDVRPTFATILHHLDCSVQVYN